MMGRFLMGPLPPDAVHAEIETAMARYDLAIPRDDDVALRIVLNHDGTYLVAEGPGVKGYLVDTEGIEASGSDVEDFFARFLSPGGAIGINGHHEVPGGAIILCRTTITLCPEDGCLIQSRRTHVALDNGPGLASDAKCPMEFSL